MKFLSNFILRNVLTISNKSKLRHFSAGAVKRISAESLLTNKDLGDMYTVNEHDFNTLFKPQLKEDFYRLLTLFDDRSILIRNPAVTVINYLKNTNFSKPAVKYLFYGHIGSGKSVQMAHISHYLFGLGDWMIVNFPNSYDFLHYSPELDLSPRFDSYDTPTLSVKFLTSFLEMNKSFFAKFEPVTNELIQWNISEQSEKGCPLMKIIEFGINRPLYASDCIEYLLKEIKTSVTLNKFKVLFIMRGIQSLYKSSHKHDIKLAPIESSRISVLRTFRQIISEKDWINACFLTSVNPELDWNVLERSKYDPIEIMGKTCFKDLDPFVPIEVGPYSLKAFEMYLNFLNENGWLTIPKVMEENGEGRKEIEFLTCRNPEEIFQITKEW